MDTNPWSVEGWNITAQAAYFRKYGRARAEARAHDAGSFFGATKPPKAKTALQIKPRFGAKPEVKLPAKPSLPVPGPPALTQPPKAIGLYTDHLTDHQKRVLYFVRRRRSTAYVLPVVSFGLGFDTEVIAPTVQFSAAYDFGFTFDFTATDLYREIDIVLNPGDLSFAASFNFGLSGPRTVFGGVTPIFPPAFNFGFTQSQPPVELSRNFGASIQLGIDHIAAAFGNQREITADMQLGFSESWLFNEYNSGVFNFSMGLSEAAAIERARETSASFALGFDQASTVTRDTFLTVPVALGFNESAQPPTELLNVAVNMGLNKTVLLDQSIQFDALTLPLGFTQTTAVDRVWELTVPTLSVGFDQVTGQPAATIEASADLGFDEVVAIDMFASLSADHFLGFDADATVDRSRELAIALDVGFDQMTGQPSLPISASADLGFDESAVTDVEFELTADNLFGFDVTVATARQYQLSANNSLGFNLAAALAFERNPQPSDILMGFTVTPTFSFIQNLDVAPDMGFTFTADIDRSWYLTVPMDFGFDQAGSPNDDHIHVTHVGTSLTSGNGSATSTLILDSTDVGDESNYRWILVTVGAQTARTLLSATIMGVTAQILVQRGPSGTRSTAIIIAKCPTGTSGNVVLNWSGINQAETVIGIYRLIAGTGVDRLIFQTAAGDSTATYGPDDYAMPAGSALFQTACASNSTGGQDFTFTEADDYDIFASGINVSYGASHREYNVAETYSAGAVIDHGGSINSWCLVAIQPAPPESYADAANSFGFSEAALVTPAFYEVPAVPAMGFSQSVVVTPERDLTLSLSMGYSEAAAVLSSRNLTAAPAMGFSAAVTPYLQKNISAAIGMGFSEAAAVTKIRNLTASPTFGFVEGAAVDTSTPVVPLVTTYLSENHINNQSSATFTFTAVGIGAAASDRWVVLLFSIKNNVARTINSITVGGITATIIGATNGASNQATGMNGIAVCNVPTGTTANVVFNMSGTFTASTVNGIGVDVYRVVGPLNTTPADSFDFNSTTNPSKAFTVPAGGCCFVISNTASTAGTRSAGADFPADDNYVQYVAGAFRFAGHFSTAGGATTATLAAVAWSGAANYPVTGRSFGN